MNKSELVDAIAKETGFTKKDSEAALQAAIGAITKTLVSGDKVQLVGFGTFEVSKRPARKGRNPQTGEPMKIAACQAPKFRAGKGLKTAVNAKKKKK